MEKQRPPKLDEPNPALDGPDYLALVIEWDDLAESIEHAQTLRGTTAAPGSRMSISDNDPSWNRVDEASLESFPASDPPAWGSAHAVAVPEDFGEEVTAPFEARPQMSGVRRLVLGFVALAALISMVEGLRRLRFRA